MKSAFSSGVACFWNSPRYAGRHWRPDHDFLGKASAFAGSSLRRGWPPPGLAWGIPDLLVNVAGNDSAPGIYFSPIGLGSDVLIHSCLLLSSLLAVLPLYHGNEWSYKRSWDKSPGLSIVFRLSSKTQWLKGSTTLISSAFTALLNCAEVGQRNRILTNYQFLSHSLFPLITRL